MSNRGLTIIIWTLGSISLLMAAGTIAFVVLGTSDRSRLYTIPFFVTCATIGSLIASRQPRNLIGWIMLGGGFSFTLMEFTGTYALYGLVVWPGMLPGARLMAWPQTWLWVSGATLLYLLLPLYFPNGQLPSPRWRWFARFIISAAVVMAITSGFAPGDEMIQVDGDDPRIVNPFGMHALQSRIPGSLQLLIEVATSILPFGFLSGAVISLLVRFRRSMGVERQQMKWFTFAITALPILIALDSLFHMPVSLATLWLVCIPFGVGVAILRHNLYDIDLIINRTIVYTALSASVVGIYIFAVTYLGFAVAYLGRGFGLGTDPLERSGHNLVISLVATGAVAVLFQPIREHLQRGVNRLMFGERDEPYTVLSRLGQRLEGTLAPDAALATIVETVREALKLPYTAIALWEDDRLDTVASSGTLSDTPLRLPLTYQQEPVGELILAPRSPREAFGPADRRLLADLARQVGIVARNVRLTHQTMRLNADLQRSREQLVLSREEERRRLQRELHDGLAPTLAALNLKAGNIRSLVRSDSNAAEAVLDEWRSEIRQTIQHVRNLAYELRPPILDELGLIAAIRERVAQTASTPCQVTIEAPERLGPLPAAVELAAYRIFQEAITNVERHAQAHSCNVRMWVCDEVPPALCLEVTDDGCGIPADRLHHPGVGLLSMRERVAELGGTCVVEWGVVGGTRIFARLPIERE